MEDKRFEEYKNGLQAALEDGLPSGWIENALPPDWEVYDDYSKGSWVVLNMKDPDLNFEHFEDNILDYYDDWATRFSQEGLLLGVCGRSCGYWGFKEKSFLNHAIEIDEEGARELYEEDKEVIEINSDNRNAAFNAGYENVFRDDKNTAKAYKVINEVRKAMEDFKLESEATRESWKNEDIDDFMNEDAE